MEKEYFTMQKISIILIATLALVALIGCGGSPAGYAPGQVEEAYAYTHGGYVGKATVRVDSEGALSVTLDEAFLPHTLGIVDFEAEEWTEENTAYYVQRGSEVRVAKWVEYDGTVYVGETVGAALVYVEADEEGNPAGAKDLELQILQNQGTMAAYYANIQNGGFKIFTEFGGEAMEVNETSYGGVTKLNSPGYWNFGQTWAGNMEAIEAFVEENGFSYSLSDMNRATTEDAEGLKKWTVGDTLTGATNSDFKDYFGVIHTAAARLEMQ
jgi:hypothetical protein